MHLEDEIERQKMINNWNKSDGRTNGGNIAIDIINFKVVRDL